MSEYGHRKDQGLSLPFEVSLGPSVSSQANMEPAAKLDLVVKRLHYLGAPKAFGIIWIGGCFGGVRGEHM